MSAIAAELLNILGSDTSGRVVPWAEMAVDQQQKIMAAIASQQPPACMALPSTTEALSKVMALACQNNWRVLLMGQGTKLSWGGLAEGIDVVISTAQLNEIVEHAAGDFTVTVQSGLTVAALQRRLAEQGQFLAIDPAFDGQATVGGVVATADTGSLRQRYGGLRDMLIGVQFVRYDGEVARAGGRVVKNVAGYDLMKLMTGAYGSLGILSELTFRLYPMPASSRSLLLSGGASAVEAAVAEVRLSGLTPVALDVLSASLAATTLSQRVGGELDQEELDSDQKAERRRSQSVSVEDSLTLVARFQGIEAGVAEQSERLQKIATTHATTCVLLEGAADRAFWQRSAATIRASAVLCKVGLRPSGIPWLIALADMVIPGADVRLYGSSGLGWIQFEAADTSVDSLIEVLAKLRSHCQKNAGFLTILQAPQSLKQAMEVWGYSGNALGVMKDIKGKFDPQRLLNPGRFVGDL